MAADQYAELKQGAFSRVDEQADKLSVGNVLTQHNLPRWTCHMLRTKPIPSGFGGLEVACWPLVPKFAGSNPAEAVRFFRAKKSSARLPSEGK